MKNLRDLFIVIGLFVALILFVVFGPGRQDQTGQSGLPTTHSTTAEGARAFYDWARAMGYDAQRLEYRPFELTDEDDTLVILNPSRPIDRTQTRAILDWVEGGGTLIFADDTSTLFGVSNALLDELKTDIAIYSTTTTIQNAWPAQPALDQPPTNMTTVRTERMLLIRSDDYVKLLGPLDAVVIAGMKRGRGYIYISAATYPFTNDGLNDQENAALALNMLRRTPAGGRILFDEYHHGFFTPPSAGSILFGNPWGWAAAYAVLSLALYLVLSGRRFGRPIPLVEEIARRSSAEYVENMADLFQRGKKRAYILRHYYTDFKRRLARPYGVNPQLDDHEFVRELSRYHTVNEQALLAMLARLRAEELTESDLVRTVTDANELLATLH